MDNLFDAHVKETLHEHFLLDVGESIVSILFTLENLKKDQKL